MYNPNHFVDAQYKSELNRAYKELDVSEERALLIEAKAGNTRAQNKLVDSQLFQILKIAGFYVKFNPRNEIKDLMAVAVTGHTGTKGKVSGGLIRAIQDFDLNQEVRFITFALGYARDAIRDYGLDNDLVRNGRHKRKAQHNNEKHLENLEYEADLRGMTVDEFISHKRNQGEDISRSTKAQQFGITSFDAPIGDDSGTTFLDTMGAENIDEHEKSVSDQLNLMLEILDDDEMKLLNEYYGLNQNKMTVREIGDEWGVSRTTISNRHNDILKKIRKNMSVSVS